MSLFKKKKPNIENPIKEMTPLGLVTDLYVTMLVADNRIEYSEKEAWNKSIEKLFPDYNSERAEQALRHSFSQISDLDKFQRLSRVREVLLRLQAIYSTDKLSQEILPELKSMVDADGIVMSSESALMTAVEEIMKDISD